MKNILSKISTGYKWKCRKCGEVFGSCAGGCAFDVVKEVIANGSYKMGVIEISMLRIHFCGDFEAFGVADFIGSDFYVEDKKNETT